MNNREELIRVFKEQANQIGYWIGAVRLGHDWHSYEGLGDLETRVHSGDRIAFVKPGGNAIVTFKDIRPKGLSKAEYGPAKLTNQVANDVNSVKIVNESDNVTIERSYTYNEDETRTLSEEVGVSVGLQIRQLIGYGGELAQVNGETEITLAINSHFNKQWGTSNSTGREISNTIKVPPKTEVEITTTKNKADFEQTAKYDCELDYTIVIWSRHDYEYEIKSVDELINLVNGNGNYNHPLTRLFKDKPLKDNEMGVIRPVNLKFEKTIQFSNASSGGVRITERKL